MRNIEERSRTAAPAICSAESAGAACASDVMGREGHTVAPSACAKFGVQLVPHDAREEESLHSALDALVRLSDVANTIFNGITDR